MGKDRELKYKVIKEYERYYLTEHKNGWKECFDKALHKPDKDDYITKKLDLRHEREFYRKEEEENER